MKSIVIESIHTQEKATAESDAGVTTIKISIGNHGAACTVIGFSVDEAVRRAVIIADAFIAKGKEHA